MGHFTKQDGASAVLVAISLFVLFGVGALAIDLGSAWATKRDALIDTDAAALAAAVLAADKGCDDLGSLQATADTYFNVNTSSGNSVALDPITCSYSPNIVRASYTASAQQALSGVLDVDSLDVFASSTAYFSGLPVSPGMRPIAACYEDLLEDGTSLSSSPILGGEPEDNDPVTYYLSMIKTWKHPACGGDSGDWGWLCFEGNCGASDTKDYLEDGYDGYISLGELADGDEDCAIAGGNQDCTTKNGTNGKSVRDSLDELMTRGVFSIVVTDDVTSSSGGEVSPWAFAYVSLDGYCFVDGLAPKTGGSFDSLECATRVATELLENSQLNPLILKLNFYGIQRDGPPRNFVNFEPHVNLCSVDGDSRLNPCDS